MARYARVFAALLALAMALVPAAAFAAGTGDDPRITFDQPTLATIAAGEDYESWLGEVSIVGSDIPYRYFWTPTHAQERSYWCGPAAVQTVDDYYGAPATQSEIATWLGTTSGGTDFSRVDDAVTRFAGVTYVYSGPASSTYDVLNRIQYGLYIRNHPAIGDFNVPATWPNYNFAHAGHIIPIEAFDWRYSTVRLNDPYSEAAWMSGGGYTLGHKTYDKSLIAAGIYNHWRRAMVY